MKIQLPLLVIALFLLLSRGSHATVCTWNGPALGDWSDPANWSCGIVPGAMDTVKLMAQSVTLNTAATIQSLILSQNCTMEGSGTLSISGEIDLRAGGDHTFLTKIIANGTIEANAATLHFNAQPFMVRGAANFVGGVFWMNNGGTFEIDPTGVATFQGKSNFYCFNAYFGFVVRGKVVKTGSSSMDFESLYLFQHASIHIESGSLINYFYQSPYNCVIDSSTIQIATDGQLQIERIVEISNTSIAGEGKILVGLGYCHFIHPNNVLVDVVQIEGICAATNGVDTLPNYTLSGGMMGGGIHVKGKFDWKKGNMIGMAVDGFATISDTTVSTINQKSLSGTLILNGGGVYRGNDPLGGTVKISANTIFALDAHPSANFKSDLQIFGTLRKMNSEAVSVGFVVNNGRIEGLGKIEGTLIAQGTLAPGIGTGTGTLSFNGPNLLIQAQNILEIQISQMGNAIASDLLNLIGPFKLAGTFNLLVSGNIPSGDYIVVQSNGVLTGAFAQINLPPDWELIQHPNDITLRKLPIAPVANFLVPQTGCAPAMVQFEDASAGDSLLYAWTFPGGIPAASSEKNPKISYASGGIYHATLTVTNGLGMSTFSTEFSLFTASETVLEKSICAGDSYYFEGQYLTIPGVYQQKLQNVLGCDSTITLYLAVQVVAFLIEQSDSGLIANATDGSFQWLDCSNFAPIGDATDAVFNPGISGDYAVIVMQDGCRDTSDCFQIALVSTHSPLGKSASFQVFPNPASDLILLSWITETGEVEPDAILVFNLLGVPLKRFEIPNMQHPPIQLDVSGLQKGPCFLVLEQAGNRFAGIQRMILE